MEKVKTVSVVLVKQVGPFDTAFALRCSVCREAIDDVDSAVVAHRELTPDFTEEFVIHKGRCEISPNSPVDPTADRMVGIVPLRRFLVEYLARGKGDQVSSD